MHTLEQLKSGELHGLKLVKIKSDLTTIPKEIFSLSDNLEILDLSGNKLSEVPNDIIKLTKLKILFLSDNNFTVFPEVLGRCSQLEMIGFKNNQILTMSEHALPINTRWLILTNNKLSSLPASIGKCYRMQKLMLAGNQLKSLPLELSNCKNLGLLRISANKLTWLPDWLLTMPKLSWLAFSGNPFCKTIEEGTIKLKTIDWDDLTINEKLGEGASGIIWKAIWNNEVHQQIPVAVKIFKGAMTSDGLPDDEMNACILAGSHPNLVNVLGKIKENDEMKKGLVLSLIPPHYKILGHTPSFESCTRDVFKAETTFSINTILEIAKGIASVATQLHEKGINHGDLYAHNILIHDTENEIHPLLSDFGAATVYDKEDTKTSFGLQRIEVSAFGCLLDDLLTHIQEEDSQKEVYHTLKNIQRTCLLENVSLRPSFEEIGRLLEIRC